MYSRSEYFCCYCWYWIFC